MEETCMLSVCDEMRRKQKGFRENDRSSSEIKYFGQTTGSSWWRESGLNDDWIKCLTSEISDTYDIVLLVFVVFIVNQLCNVLIVFLSVLLFDVMITNFTLLCFCTFTFLAKKLTSLGTNRNQRRAGVLLYLKRIEIGHCKE